MKDRFQQLPVQYGEELAMARLSPKDLDRVISMRRRGVRWEGPGSVAEALGLEKADVLAWRPQMRAAGAADAIRATGTNSPRYGRGKGDKGIKDDLPTKARTTVSVDASLLEEARLALSTEGLSETINAALSTVARRHHLAQFDVQLFDVTDEDVKEGRRERQ